MLNKYKIFDNFITCNANIFPFTLLKTALANHKSLGTGNVIHLYGVKGMGKTHLLQASINQAKEDGVKASLLHIDDINFNTIQSGILLFDDIDLYSKEQYEQFYDLLHFISKMDVLVVFTTTDILEQLDMCISVELATVDNETLIYMGELFKQRYQIDIDIDFRNLVSAGYVEDKILEYKSYRH